MESHGVEARMYADDLKVFAPTTTALNTQCIQTALDSLHEWSRVWQLPLAENKCTVLHLGRNNPKQQYTLGSITLEGSDEIRDLGFIIDKNLKFSAHIKMIAQKAMLASNMILRALKTKKVEVLIKAYTVYIRSILESGMIVSSPVLKLDKARLEKYRTTSPEECSRDALVYAIPTFPNLARETRGWASLHLKREEAIEM